MDNHSKSIDARTIRIGQSIYLRTTLLSIGLSSFLTSLCPFPISTWRGRQEIGRGAGQNHKKIPPAGIEPATPGLGNRCSILLSYEGSHIALTLWKSAGIYGNQAPAARIGYSLSYSTRVCTLYEDKRSAYPRNVRPITHEIPTTSPPSLSTNRQPARSEPPVATRSSTMASR